MTIKLLSWKDPVKFVSFFSLAFFFTSLVVCAESPDKKSRELAQREALQQALQEHEMLQQLLYQGLKERSDLNDRAWSQVHAAFQSASELTIINLLMQMICHTEFHAHESSFWQMYDWRDFLTTGIKGKVLTTASGLIVLKELISFIRIKLSVRQLDQQIQVVVDKLTNLENLLQKAQKNTSLTPLAN